MTLWTTTNKVCIAQNSAAAARQLLPTCRESTNESLPPLRHNSSLSGLMINFLSTLTTSEAEAARHRARQVAAPILETLATISLGPRQYKCLTIVILITEQSTCCSLPSRKRPPCLTSLPAPPSRFSSRPIRVNVHFVYSSEPSHISRLRSRRHHHRLRLLVGRMVGLAGPAPTPLHTTASNVSLVCNLPSRRRREEAARE